MSENPSSSSLLTQTEKDIINGLGEILRLFVRDVLDEKEDRVAQIDRTEFRTLIQLAQRYIMAQAAARAYPDEFRIIGQKLPAHDDELYNPHL